MCIRDRAKISLLQNKRHAPLHNTMFEPIYTFYYSETKDLLDHNNANARITSKKHRNTKSKYHSILYNYTPNTANKSTQLDKPSQNTSKTLATSIATDSPYSKYTKNLYWSYHATFPKQPRDTKALKMEQYTNSFALALITNTPYLLILSNSTRNTQHNTHATSSTQNTQNSTTNIKQIRPTQLNKQHHVTSFYISQNKTSKRIHTATQPLRQYNTQKQLQLAHTTSPQVNFHLHATSHNYKPHPNIQLHQHKKIPLTHTTPTLINLGGLHKRKLLKHINTRPP